MLAAMMLAQQLSALTHDLATHCRVAGLSQAEDRKKSAGIRNPSSHMLVEERENQSECIFFYSFIMHSELFCFVQYSLNSPFISLSLFFLGSLSGILVLTFSAPSLCHFTISLFALSLWSLRSRTFLPSHPSSHFGLFILRRSFLFSF